MLGLIKNLKTKYDIQVCTNCEIMPEKMLIFKEVANGKEQGWNLPIKTMLNGNSQPFLVGDMPVFCLFEKQVISQNCQHCHPFGK